MQEMYLVTYRIQERIVHEADEPKSEWHPIMESMDVYFTILGALKKIQEHMNTHREKQWIMMYIYSTEEKNCRLRMGFEAECGNDREVRVTVELHSVIHYKEEP